MPVEPLPPTSGGDGEVAKAPDRPFRARRRLAGFPLARYSWSKLFFNFYLFAMGSFIVIGFIADLIISASLQGITEDYARRFMRGTVTLIEDELRRHPVDQWAQVIRQLDEKFSYRLELSPLDRINLDENDQARLAVGEITVDPRRDVMYHRIRDTDFVLTLGPLSAAHNQENDRPFPSELRIRALTWALIGLGFAVVAWLWLRPLWRDLEALRQTARGLGEGKFETRAPAARSQTFALLSETLNRMAERIQLLVATQKEMSSTISHELRTPIARMRFALEMLADAEDREDRERLWKQMAGDLDELDTLIDSSLTYARFERERPEVRPQPVAIGPWIEEQIAALRPLGRHLSFQADLGTMPGTTEVDLDPRFMPFAVRNLLRNAVLYARSTITVRTGTEEEGGQTWFLIHVDDDGIGVPEEARERIFTAFTRLDRSRDRSAGGYGLGLAIAKLILELHGGHAQADTSPEGGARFTLRWPLRCPPPLPSP